MPEQEITMFHTYQILIASFLGFSGVIITMLANAKMQRDQHKRNISHQANSLRVAIKSELNTNKKTYELRLNQFDVVSGTNIAVVPNGITDNIYQKLLNQIGLLTEAEIDKVTEAYLTMAELPYRLRLLVGTDNVKGFNNELICIDANRRESAKKLHENSLPAIKEAIETINSNLKKA